MERIKSRALLYSSLEYFTADEYCPVNKHWILQHSGIARDVPGAHVKLKLVTGTYILQVSRYAFSQNEIDPTCLMYKEEPETVGHFLIRCSALAEVRQPIMDSILKCAKCFMQAPFRKLSSIYVFSYFPFGFEGRIWDLIVSVPDHCLSFYFL